MIRLRPVAIANWWLWSQWVVLLQRLDDGRYVPIRRPMAIDRMAPSCLRWLEVEAEQRDRCSVDEQLHHRVIESIASDQGVDGGDC